jgi:hypothetical protein
MAKTASGVAKWREKQQRLISSIIRRQQQRALGDKRRRGGAQRKNSARRVTAAATKKHRGDAGDGRAAAWRAATLNIARGAHHASCAWRAGVARCARTKTGIS